MKTVGQRRRADHGESICGRPRAAPRSAVRAGSAVGLTDGELLERFAHRRDEAAEAAFEILLARHGAMVLTVCRQVLGDSHAAEDAFQATFLVVVRRRRFAASSRARLAGPLAARGRVPHCLEDATRGRAATGARASGRGAGGREAPPPRSSTASSGRCCTTRSTGCRRSTAHRWCSATSRAGRTTRPPRPCDGPWGRSAAGWPGPATASEPGSPAAAWPRTDGSDHRCWDRPPGSSLPHGCWRRPSPPRSMGCRPRAVSAMANLMLRGLLLAGSR